MRTLAPLAALSCLLSLASLSAQEDISGLFGETVSVQLINVEVVVTDREGRRVEGLDLEDFALLVDGIEVPVEYFTEVRGGHVASGDVSSGPLTETRPGTAVGTNYLVFIDEYYTIGTQRDLAVRRFRESLGSLRPADRMAVLAYNGQSLDVLQEWTSDRDRLEETFERAVERRTTGPLREPERRRLGIMEIGIASEEFEMIADAVTASMRAMPRPEGRSVLVLLAGAWPTGPSVGIMPGGLPTMARDIDRVDDAATLRPVVETANLLGYTLYPVDVAGLRVDAGQGRLFGSSHELQRWGSLRRVAMDTGGRVSLAGDRLKALERVADDTSSYYWLGFSPLRQHDGKRHSIEVRLREPGMQARSRDSYRDLTRQTEMAMAVESALLLEREGSGEFHVALGQSERRRGSKMKVPVTVDIPWDQVTLVPTQEGLQGRVELRFGVKDDRGALSEIATTPLDLLRDQSDPEPSFRWAAAMLLRREPHELVVSLYDAGSGRTTSESILVDFE